VSIGEIAVAPVHEGEQDRLQVLPGLGQVVLESWWPLGVLDPLQDARVGEFAQPGRQDVARCAGIGDHLLEAPFTEEHLAQR
jgi:hypothetical protein